MRQILISLTFDDLLNWIAIIGFVFIFIQIYLSDKDVRLTRSIDLIGRYFSNYHYLQTLFKRLETGEKQRGGILSHLMNFSAEEINILQQNYDKQIDFFFELALYWNKNLIDKQLIREQLKEKIDTANVIIHELAKQKEIKDRTEQLDLFVEMMKEMQFKDYVSYNQYQLYLKMGIIKETNSPTPQRK